eukprot:m.196351 g.196351  ORF g.196351 m.196351 type:complete len:75 (-) comp53745_c0_seq1:1226-1450(-)
MHSLLAASSVHTAKSETNQRVKQSLATGRGYEFLLNDFANSSTELQLRECALEPQVAKIKQRHRLSRTLRNETR